MLDPEQTVGEVMRKYPQTVHVFIELKMNCVGCSLKEFCSLAYAARCHQVELDLLLERLQKTITNGPG